MKATTSQPVAEVAKRVHPPVDAETDLDNIPPSARVDKMVCMVGTGANLALWAFSDDDTSAEVAGSVRQPASGTGRWRMIQRISAGSPSPDYVQTWTDPVAASANGLRAATATVATTSTVLAAALEAAGKAALLANPRNVTFTTAGGTAADAPATATITGTDIDDNALTETVNLAQTATIASGVKAFKTIVSIAFAAGDGTDATVAIGFGSVFGLAVKPKLRSGIVAVVQEYAAGALATNGTFVVPATSPPYGTYAPNSAPDGSKDYAVRFERDLT
jgi:hypothetical protein